MKKVLIVVALLAVGLLLKRLNRGAAAPADAAGSSGGTFDTTTTGDINDATAANLVAGAGVPEAKAKAEREASKKAANLKLYYAALPLFSTATVAKPRTTKSNQ